jgi:parallel beta-helix repeat protein
MLTRPSTGMLLGGAAGLVVVIALVVAMIGFGGDDDPSAPVRAPVAAGDRPPPRAAVTCDRFAAGDGNDEADGSLETPFQGMQRLADSLQPGQTGCLAAGEYDGDVEIGSGGATGQPITLTAADPAGERPVVRGRIVVADTANDVVISGLVLNGRNDEKLPSPTINGDNVVLLDNEITNDNFGICVNLGHPSYGTAVGTVIQDNRIHNCGEYPATNLEHGIYVNVARDTTITGNLIYDNADRGIQMYPDAQNTRITNNVIDGNGTGVIFSGTDGAVSSDNYVAHNIITNSVRYNIDAYWGDEGGPVGQGNVVEDNCLWGAGIDEVSDQEGFTVLSNFTVDPEFTDRAAARYSLTAGSPCVGRLPSWLAS